MKKYFELLELARKSIESELEGKEIEIIENIKRKYSKKQACFVTLTINGDLRGCIGSLEPGQELWKDVVENARNAAFSDSRFPALSETELKKIKIEISVLSVPEEIFYKDAEELKKKIKAKGVIIRKGFYSATYLAQVWEEIKSDSEFLSSLCAKAGLLPNIWRDNSDKLRVWTYTVERIEEI